MTALTKEFILTAFDIFRVWDFGNKILYRLCKKHPNHIHDAKIIAKIWLIGRSYAATVERGRDATKKSGDDYYSEDVAPKIRKSDIDIWFECLRKDQHNSCELNIKIHKKLTKLLCDISGQGKRSLASKYLHFHFPDRFFIYDGRADGSVQKLIGRASHTKKLGAVTEEDITYSAFFKKCEKLRCRIKKLIGRDPTPREVDMVLLHYSNECEKARSGASGGVGAATPPTP